MSRTFRVLSSLVLVVVCASARAATYVVPPDRVMIESSDAIVTGRALHSHAEKTPDHGIETITVFAVEDVLKGDAALADGLRVHGPGGMVEGGDHKTEVEIVPGAPSFEDGEHVLLFLRRTPDGDYATADLGLGSFGFATDDLGHRVIVRTASDLVGWNPDGSVYEEPHRDVERFLAFIRDTVQHRPAASDYTIKSSALVHEGRTITTAAFQPNALSAFTATQYTLAPNSASEGGQGSRWKSFPSVVNWNRGNSGINVANGGTDLINAAFASWNNEPSSNINFVLSSFNANPNGIRESSDGVNNVVFEKDMTAFGVAAFSCSNGGVLGTAGIHHAVNDPTNIVNGELFYQITEGDASMNQGTGACLPGGANTLSLGNFLTAITHEIGHALSFRHSDQSRTLTQVCTNFATYDCTTSALMNHILLEGDNGALTPWDARAAETLYPAPPAPANVVAAVAPSGNVALTWTAVTGAISYTVYRSADNVTWSIVGTPATNAYTDVSASPNTAYLYKATATISGVESPFSNRDLATTVVFTDPVLTVQVTTVKAAHLTELRTAVDAVRKLANGGVSNAFAYTDGSVTPQLTGIRRVHIQELRDALDPARASLGLPALSYADPVLTQVTPIKALHLVALRNGVL